MSFDSDHKLRRFQKGSKPVPMPPSHGQLLKRIQFEKRYIDERCATFTNCPPELSLEAMEASLKYIEGR